MLNHIEYRAFTASYNKPVNSLIAPVGILPLLTVDKASFSFAMPSFPERIDLTKKAKDFNK